MSTNMQDPMRDPMHDPDREDLGAEGNDALIDPLPEDEEHPRPEEVDPEAPLGTPRDPSEDDPSKIQGDPAEDET